MTIEDVWSTLIRNADTKVLKPKRTGEFERTGKWLAGFELRYSSRDRDKHKSPAHLVAKVALPPSFPL